jgi:hypothetical protein
MFGKKIIPKVFRAKKKKYDEYKVNSTWSLGISSLFFYSEYNESNSLEEYFYTSTIPDHL